MSKRRDYLNQLIETGILREDEEEIFTFGIHQGLLIIINILTIMAIGLIFGMLWQSIVFMVAYIPLRSYAGGYHAKTQVQCYLFSVVLAVVAIMGMKYIFWTGIAILAVLTISTSIIFILAPIEDFNKPLTREEREVFKARTRKILLIESLITVVSLLAGFGALAVCVLISITSVSMMLILGRISSRDNNQLLVD